MALGGLFGASLPWTTPPFVPQPGTEVAPFPGMTPSPTPQPRWLQGLSSPSAQIALSLLANSRRPDGRATPIGQAAGNAVLGYQQQQRDLASEELRKKYVEAQIQKMQQGETANPENFGQLEAVMGPDGKMRFVQAGNRGTIRPVDGYTPSPLQQYGRVNPGDFTPESLAAYAKSGDFKDLVRIWAPDTATVAGVPTVVGRQVGGGVGPGGQPMRAPLSSIANEAAAQGALAEGKAVGQARGEARGGAEKKGFAANQTLATLDIAEPLIDAATGSLAGSGVDRLAAVFGEAPKGAQAIAALKVLQANLMTSMPRMEGPQSDRDVQLYREAAGQIGDPTVPKDIKKAAVNTIREINKRYQQAAGVTPTQPQNKVRKYNPQTGKIE